MLDSLHRPCQNKDCHGQTSRPQCPGVQGDRGRLGIKIRPGIRGESDVPCKRGRNSCRLQLGRGVPEETAVAVVVRRNSLVPNSFVPHAPHGTSIKSNCIDLLQTLSQRVHGADTVMMEGGPIYFVSFPSDLSTLKNQKGQRAWNVQLPTALQRKLMT